MIPRREALLRRLDTERRTLAQVGRSLEILPHVTRVSSADRSHQQIKFSSLNEETADTVIAEQAAYYRALGVAAEWTVYSHDGPPDLLERVQRHGFQPGPREAVVVLSLQTPPKWVREPSAAPVLRVENEEQVQLHADAAAKIFKKPFDFTANELRSAIKQNATGFRGYILMQGNAAVSVGRLHTDPESIFGGLYGGGTVAEFRGRGFYRAVIAARARDAIALGASYVFVDALPTSRPILERLGFVRITDAWPCKLQL